MLRSTLLSLTDIVLLLVISLGGLVASDTGKSAADCASHTATDATSQVGDLAYGLLLLTLAVLLTSRLLQALYDVCRLEK